MVEAALEQERSGEDVVIIVARAMQINDIKRRLPPDSKIRILPVNGRGVNLEEMRIDHRAPDERNIFVDHYVRECQHDESMRRLRAHQQNIIKPRTPLRSTTARWKR